MNLTRKEIRVNQQVGSVTTEPADVAIHAAAMDADFEQSQVAASAGEERWREAEYDKLAGLRAGYSLDRFRQLLGAPLFVAPVQGTRNVESIFQGRDYWVQVVASADGTAISYAVTSCSEDFNPRFELPSGVGGTASVTLQRTPLSGVLDEVPGGHSVSISGATADSWAFIIHNVGNGTNYKTYAWGLNDSCPWLEGVGTSSGGGTNIRPSAAL